MRKLVILGILLLPQIALAEMDQATIMMIQEQNDRNRKIEAENDRIMFQNITTGFGGSDFGAQYARQYGCAQAKAMFFGAEIKGCDGRQRAARQRVTTNRRQALVRRGILPVATAQASSKPVASSDLLWLSPNAPAEKPIAQQVAEVKPANLEPASNIQAPKPVQTRKPVRRKTYDPDDNPDELAWRRAHRR